MWMVALIGMCTAMVEATLAQIYKHRTAEANVFRGGPAYYMEKGLGQRWMGILFSIFLIIAFGLVFNAVQSNSMTVAMDTAFGVNRLITGLIIAALTGIIIFGGIRRIARFAEVVVPFMAIVYLSLALFVVISRIDEVPGVLWLIIRSAFGWEEAAAGGIGYAIAQAMMQGIKRGLFSNEAGLGSAPNAAATADIKHPASQGYVQSLGVFVDTIVICTATAAMILLSGIFQPGQEVEGVSLTQSALSAEVGNWGTSFIAIALLFFSFTSIVANYYYGETSLMFIYENPKALIPFRIVVIGMVIFGALQEVPLIWAMADLSMGLMALLNLIAILLLSGIAFKVIHDYDQQLREGKEPVFDKSKYPELHHHIEEDVW
jgi:AGCS family alanine or glycine:cation symporter